MAESSNVTQINSNVGRGQTKINSTLNGATTAINPVAVDHSTQINKDILAGTSTVINPDASGINLIPTNTVLLNKYVVDKQLNFTSGEADLYLCHNGNKKYVAKVYRRAKAIKEHVLDILLTLDKPYIAKFYGSGIWQNHPFEILPYFIKGSLQGHTFDFKTLQKRIIPELNEGIHALHERNILHKDIKPSNIMLCDNGKDIAIIDFGISSVRENGNTVIVTQTGLTPEYSAPETFKNIFLNESDYYSLGITIYELFCGHTPYAGADPETIEKYVSIQTIPFSDEFPTELKELIRGLTFMDISHRKEKENPNRRWTYEEVKRWCEGITQPIPGEHSGSEVVNLDSDDFMPQKYTFMYRKYSSVSQLIEALAADWQNGKRRLYRSSLKDHFSKFNTDFANYCADAEDAVQNHPELEDVEFYRCLYRLCPGLPSFYWKSSYYPTMNSLGKELMENLRAYNQEKFAEYDEFMSNHLFSIREECTHIREKERSNQVRALEDKYILAKHSGDSLTQTTQLYLIGYLYSGEMNLVIGNEQFLSVEQLIQRVKELLNSDESELDNFSYNFFLNDSQLHLIPSFRAWLIIQKYGNVLSE